MYVEMRDICKNYGNFRASDHVSFGIEKGKLVALLGPSGSGKTTLLRMIAGLETPNSGDIYIDGQRVNDVPAAKRGIGFVFQNYALFRYMTVYDNVAFGLELAKVPKKEIKKRVTELLELTGLSGMEKRYPNQLSGGQRQRVAFARALAPNPQVLLLDEPFAAIDAKVRTELRNWLREMVVKLGITSIFVTHDQDEAVEVADEIIITNHGHIEQMGTPMEIYKSPDTPFVAQFIGTPQMNLMEMRVTVDENMGIVLQNEQFQIPVSERTQRILLDAGYEGKYVIVGTRAEDIVADEIGNDETIDGMINVCCVSNVEFQGNDSYLFLELEKQEELVVKGTENHWRKQENLEKVHVSFSPEMIHIFDQESGERINEKSVLSKMCEGGAL